MGPDLGVAPDFGVAEAVDRGVADAVGLDVARADGSGSDVGGAVVGGGALVVVGCGVGSDVGSACPDVGVVDGVG
ncbi:hypothetical protein [Arthrobacter sp. PM3]|uniref:hypothetical protein n=1 Tax=Arthrobacter sp. PM3 TaxID=2017685 RepID=UPI000E105366|nr:hypothetical protein [Arthrobacter sp. PM3]AXJ09008.1 hypothetical protein CFN17_04755 [Arthrobacter sp. PM3]